MYCMNCGTKNEDQAKYCAKCGQQLVGTIVVGKEINPAKRKSRNLFMASISLVLVATITIVTIFDLWPWSARADKKADATRMEQIEEDKAAETDEGIVTFESLSLDAIIEQCPDCQVAMETYISMLKAAQDWTTSKEELEALENQLCVQMQHFCTAKQIYVEDIPYAYKGSFGLYTGDWLGAGPSGNGTYIGTIYDINIVSYTGGWGFGVPNGMGELYVENYLGDWDMTYRGGMKNGMWDGAGSWSEYCDGNEFNRPHFRIYDEATYSQDQLTDWIRCVCYYADTGEIDYYCDMTTDESGMPMMGIPWGANDLSPEEQEALGFATVVGIFGFTAYLTYSALDVDYDYDVEASNQRVLEETQRFQALDAAEKEAAARRAEEERKENQAWAGDQLDRLEANGDYGSLEYQYYEGIYYGN